MRVIWRIRSMSMAILFLLAFQAGPFCSTSPAGAQSAYVCEPATLDLASRAEYDEHELVKRFNGLVKALGDFADTYNAGKIDVKKAKAVQKALHELQKSEWFKAQKVN